MTGGKRFTIIDLKDAFLQFEVHPKSRDLLVIATPIGYYRYKKLTFGVKVAPSLIQGAIDKILEDLDNLEAYLDDNKITGLSDTEHFQNLKSVLGRLKEIRITTQNS